MSGGPKRNEDKLNTIGIVVVGICGAVLVYVTITALQAFYMNDTSEIQTMADYGGQDTTVKGLRSQQLANITEAASNGTGTYRISIDKAIELVAADAKKPAGEGGYVHLTGAALAPATKATIAPKFGRPSMGGDAAPAPAPADGAAAPADGAGSAAPDMGAAGSAAPQTPTGSGPGAPPAAPSRDAAQPAPARPTP